MADTRGFFTLLTAGDWLTKVDGAIVVAIGLAIAFYTHVLSPTKDDTSTPRPTSLLKALTQWNHDEKRFLVATCTITMFYVSLRVLGMMGLFG